MRLTDTLNGDFFVIFRGKSNKKLGTREKSLQAPFAHAAKGEPSVGHLLAIPGFRLFPGCCGTCFVRLYKKIYTRTKLQTVLTQWPENSRPSVGFFNGAVSPSATDYLCTQHSTGNSKTKPAPLKDTSKVLLVFGNSGRTV